MNKTIFTGQTIDEYENVICPVCGKKVNVRIGWIDRYNGNKYVHYGCLSQKRLTEIRESV